MVEKNQEKVELPLDHDRIRTILREAYTTCQDVLVVTFDEDIDTFVSKIEPYLKCNRVSTVVPLRLSSRKYPDLLIEVNLQKKKLIARMVVDRMRVHLNRFLTKL